MLKKIPVSQARVGMHLHKLEGAWLNHPFWKTKFTITDPEDLRKLQASGVPFLWIDDALGLACCHPRSTCLPLCVPPRWQHLRCHALRQPSRRRPPGPWAKS